MTISITLPSNVELVVIASRCHCVMCYWHKPWDRLTRVKSSSQV
ncbi:hypothetical protein [Escherichia coli]|nr:hypothetical protein [Escherichia coli]